MEIARPKRGQRCEPQLAFAAIEALNGTDDSGPSASIDLRLVPIPAPVEQQAA